MTGGSRRELLKELHSRVRLAIALGAADVISKPFDPMRLLDQVRMIWERLQAG